MPGAGIPRRGYRPMPRDFPETFIRVGWDSIEEAMRANKRTIRRWLREENASAIRAAIETGSPVTLLEGARDAWLKARYAASGKGKPGRKPVR